jgi:hypothetical protein
MAGPSPDSCDKIPISSAGSYSGPQDYGAGGGSVTDAAGPAPSLAGLPGRGLAAGSQPLKAPGRRPCAAQGTGGLRILAADGHSLGPG